MTYPETPASHGGDLTPATNAVSLEQMLSLRHNAVAKLSSEATSSQAQEAAVQTKAQGPELPLIVVVHEEMVCGSCVKTKLQCVADVVSLAWLSLQASVVEQVHLRRPHAVMIQFSPSTLDAAIVLAKQLQQSLPHLPIFALGSTQDSQSMLSALRAGVQDFVDVDGSEADLRRSFKALLVRGKQPEVVTSGDTAPMTAILSGRAGMGSSLLAAHLAVFLQRALKMTHTGQKVQEQEALGALLLDLGAPLGDGALYLDLVSEFSFADAVQSLGRFDRKLASAGLTQHDSGLRLLSLPRQSDFLREVAYDEADLLVRRLREYFQYIVADLGGVSQTNLAIRVASKASKIWVICDQSLASVVSTTELLQQLEVQQVSRSVMELIVCRHDRNLELSAQHIADQLQLPLLMTIPERRFELLQAVNQGQLLSPTARREPYGQAIQKLVDILLDNEGQRIAPEKNVLTMLLQRVRGE